MSNATSVRVPCYRKHKPSGQAVVTICGKDHYLGVYGTAASREAYSRFIQTWLANGRQLPGPPVNPTVNELLLAYIRFAEEYYRNSNGSELAPIKAALRVVRELFGRTLAKDFGPLSLKTVQQAMIGRGWCRTTINKQISRVKRVFRWAVANELVPASVWHSLSAVPGLRFGRTEAKESEPVKPVADAFIDAIRPHVSRQVWAMISLPRLTGARPGEVTIIRTCDLEMTGPIWIYRPPLHKNTYRGHQREIYIGPKAREILRPWLRTDIQAYLFQPQEAEEERNAMRRQNRQTPGTPSQAKRQRKLKRRRPWGQKYSVVSYYKAIRRACEKANVPAWHPHQLRHTAATHLRKQFGVEMTRIILGHKTAFTTEIYAEADRQQAMEVMAKMG